MDFDLNQDQKAMVDMIREFVAREVTPYAAQWDEEERFPHETVKKLAELGVMGMVVPPEYGGTGLDFVTACLIQEEVGAGDGSLGLTVESHNSLGTGHILHFGTKEQKEKYLPDLAQGKKLAAWCLTEPGSGSDAAGLRTKAVRQGDNWVINGHKMFITQGSVGGVYVVMTSTTPEKKQKGITAFIVEGGTKGLSASKHIKKMGMRSSDTAEVILDDVVVPDTQRLGDVDHGFIDTLQILDHGRVLIAALSVGIARGAYETALQYSTERVAFGRPIAKFQAIQWMLADMYARIESSRLLTLRAAAMIDQGKYAAKESSAAKLVASETAMWVTNKAIQVLGGYGYTRDFPVERAFRDAKLLEIGEGTSEVQRLVISRELLKKLL